MDKYLGFALAFLQSSLYEVNRCVHVEGQVTIYLVAHIQQQILYGVRLMALVYFMT